MGRVGSTVGSDVGVAAGMDGVGSTVGCAVGRDVGAGSAVAEGPQAAIPVSARIKSKPMDRNFARALLSTGPKTPNGGSNGVDGNHLGLGVLPSLDLYYALSEVAGADH